MTQVMNAKPTPSFTSDLMPVAVAEGEAVVRFEGGSDGATTVIHHKDDGTLDQLKQLQRDQIQKKNLHECPKQTRLDLDGSLFSKDIQTRSGKATKKKMYIKACDKIKVSKFLFSPRNLKPLFNHLKSNTNFIFLTI